MREIWFEPERVYDHTAAHTEHPEWILSSPRSPWPGNHLLNFGLPEVQEYFFNIVKGFMELPGFRFYRQDFNIDPLIFWRDNEADDRQGVVEMHYIAGLYAFWDRIAAAWPDSIREECASGGRRIDLETLMRMHLHQESDYWFDNETDQSQIWGLSQYLPNHSFTTPLIRLDNYSFHSTFATSLCLGWIADDPDFDTARAMELMNRYRALRHLLIGAWYPLLPDARDNTAWMGMQFHRADLDEGLVLAFRRPESPDPQRLLAFHGLNSTTGYIVTRDDNQEQCVLTGAMLQNGIVLALPQHGSALLHYKATTS